MWIQEKTEWIWKDDISDSVDTKFRICILKQIIKKNGLGYSEKMDDYLSLEKQASAIFSDTKMSFSNVKDKSPNFSTMVGSIDEVLATSNYTFDSILAEYNSKKVE